MIQYLIDSSALWRVLRNITLREKWAETLSLGAAGSCHPQRIEFRRSARGLGEYEQMTDMFQTLYPDVPVPKGIWRWIESAQYRLLRNGAHQAFSMVDMMICATAAHKNLVILHDDTDFVTAGRYLPDVRERNINITPEI